jgi:sulfonate transport system substrate-binding protein
MMASAELDDGAVLFHRKPEANTWGILNVREAFAKEHPDAVARVLKVYEQARKWALANPAEVTKALAAAAKIPENVAEKQLKGAHRAHAQRDRQAATRLDSGGGSRAAGRGRDRGQCRCEEGAR